MIYNLVNKRRTRFIGVQGTGGMIQFLDDVSRGDAYRPHDVRTRDALVDMLRNMQFPDGDEWVKCGDRLPRVDQRVLLKRSGIVHNYSPLFDEQYYEDGVVMNIWDFGDYSVLVDFENDEWKRLHK